MGAKLAVAIQTAQNVIALLDFNCTKEVVLLGVIATLHAVHVCLLIQILALVANNHMYL